jgi:hypothetical protein
LSADQGDALGQWCPRHCLRERIEISKDLNGDARDFKLFANQRDVDDQFHPEDIRLRKWLRSCEPSLPSYYGDTWTWNGLLRSLHPSETITMWDSGVTRKSRPGHLSRCLQAESFSEWRYAQSRGKSSLGW